MKMTIGQRVALWGAINRYVETCGGEPLGAYENIARQGAAIDVEMVIENLIATNRDTPECAQTCVCRTGLAVAVDGVVYWTYPVHPHDDGDGDWAVFGQSFEGRGPTPEDAAINWAYELQSLDFEDREGGFQHPTLKTGVHILDYIEARLLEDALDEVLK